MYPAYMKDISITGRNETRVTIGFTADTTVDGCVLIVSSSTDVRLRERSVRVADTLPAEPTPPN
jgi:hypothetical protein